ncbi:MAG: hypothetical protein JXQ90_19055 [Cyclobacteriaceae bacterium]
MFVECDSENEIHTLFEGLSSNGGQVMVPVGGLRLRKLRLW